MCTFPPGTRRSRGAGACRRQRRNVTLHESQLQQSDSTSPAWLVSLCFWCALTCAAGIYAVVALAPKFSVWNPLRHDYRQNAQQLIALERDVDYLERVEEALRTDPEFVRRLSGETRAHSDPNSELIPVSGELLFGYVDPAENVAQQLSEPPPYHSVIRTLASHPTLLSLIHI